MNESLWSVRDVARYLGVPAATIYTWRYRGEGPPVFRVGKHLRYRPSEVAAWLEDQRETCPVPGVASQVRGATHGKYREAGQ